MRCKFGIAVLVLTVATVLSGCKETTATSDAPESNTPINSPPTITGSPPIDAVTGTMYSFTPAASDPDGDPLNFTIRGIPSWAAFDDTTGELFGIPGVGDEGTYTDIQIETNDGVVTASLSKFSVTVRTEEPPNSAPVISGTPMTTAEVGMNYSFTPTASDADGDELSFTIQNLPGWAVFDTARGTLSGVPQSTDEGLYSNILIAVSDGIDSSSLFAFSITVSPQGLPNNAPTLSGSPNATVEVGTSYVFTPIASDIDGDPLSFSIQNLPHWAAFDTQSGTLSGIPQSGDEGIYSDIQIEVSDGTSTTSLAPFSVAVTAMTLPNSAPTISGVPDTLTDAGTDYSFAPIAVDADNDTLFFTIENPPAWASFDSATGLLTGTPQSTDEGTYTGIVITVSDGDLTASLPAFSITVNAQAGPAKAFPGAEGFGAMSKGGRGGSVYVVTNLGDTGTGSLRWAIDQTEPRTIVFATSGVIELTSQLSIDHPFITIAAQTSPAGITLKGGRVKIRTHDVVIRGLRVRPGDDPDGMEPGNRDGLSIGDPNNPVYNVIIDHSSFTWAVDENGSNWFPSNNVTVQWSLFAEGLRNSIHPEGPHSMGYLIGSGSQNLSVHHNIFASNEHRNPVVADAQSIEVINNVGYNWRSEGVAVSSTGATTLHAINNYYIHGPDTTVRPAFYLRPSESDQHHIYLSGNVDSEFRPSISSGDEWDVAHGWVPEMRSNDPVFDGSGIAVDDAVSALSLVLESAGGISPERDSIDTRIVDDILANTGAIIDSPDQVGGYELPAAIAPPTDSDLDGMPDTWEESQGLDPTNADDGVDDRDGDGYTELEEYLNSFFQ